MASIEKIFNTLSSVKEATDERNEAVNLLIDFLMLAKGSYADDVREKSQEALYFLKRYYKGNIEKYNKILKDFKG